MTSKGSGLESCDTGTKKVHTVGKENKVSRESRSTSVVQRLKVLNLRLGNEFWKSL